MCNDSGWEAIGLERMAGALGYYLSSRLVLDDDRREVLPFGAPALLQNNPWIDSAGGWSPISSFSLVTSG